MELDKIHKKLQLIFDNHFFDKVTITDQLCADDVDEWDSLQQISLLIAVENEFGIRFGTGDVEQTKNVGEFKNLIQSKLNP